MSVKDLAKAVGLAQSTLYDLERGDSKDTKKVHKLAAVLNVRASWLDTGVGPMEYAIPGNVDRHPMFKHLVDGGLDRQEAATIVARTIGLENAIVPAAKNDGDNDPNLYVTKVKGARASAGNGEILFEHEEIDGSHAFKRSWLRSKGITSVDRCRMLEVKGDSMYPYIENDNIVLVNMDDRTVRDGEVYVVILDGELLVKRLFKDVDGSVELRSDNPDKSRYPSKRITGDMLDLLQVMGRVVWRAG